MSQSSNTECLTLKVDPDMAKRISAARDRLLAAAPGVAVSKSSALRHLLTLGAAISENQRKPRANQARLETLPAPPVGAF